MSLGVAAGRTAPTSTRALRLALTFIAASALIAGCGGMTRADGGPLVVPNPFTEYSVGGPYAAGTAQFVVGGDPVVVWYPASAGGVRGHQKYTYHLRAWLPPQIRALVPPSFADGIAEDAYSGVPAATGRFPVVTFSHGFGGYPEQSTFLTAHLASWGIIVVAPEQLRRDLSAVVLGKASAFEPKTDVAEQLAALAYLRHLDTTAGSILFGHVDSSKVAALGHSAGGGAAVLLAAADPAVLGWIALAGVPATPPSRPVPALLLSGSADKTVPTSVVRQFYATLRGTKELVVVDGYGHNVFDDVCAINHAHGGLTTAIRALHLPVPPGVAKLADDGCSPPDNYPATGWPLIDQVVTAWLLHLFGRGAPATSTGPPIVRAFPGVHAQYSAAS